MIRTMQRRLTAVLLAFLAVLYAGICMANYLSLRSNLERSSLEMLRRIAQDSGPRGPFDGAAPAPIPYFALQLSPQGELLAVQSGQFDLTDSDALSAVAAAVLGAPGESGYLPQYRLSYVRVPNREGWRVVCADDALRRGALSHQLQVILLLGAVLLPVFWLLSFLLAKLLLRPARRAWEQQAQFVADASHELKTPLTVILANTDMILGDCTPGDPELARRAGNIRAEGERMRTLVLDLLALARGDEGSRQGVPAAVSWSEAVESSCLAFDALVYEHGLHMRCCIQPGCTVLGQDSALRRLPSILLDNAVKYCLPGGEISVELRREKGRWAALTVSNPSPPLSPEQTRRLFDRFYRADEARSDHRGYGLGLSVARQIVQSCGGRIWCDYRQGAAVFTVYLPLSRQRE